MVALVGVPNVGKSTLFNRLVGQRRALVADLPGTTRDRIQASWSAGGIACTLCDTGGFRGGGTDALQEEIERQTMTAIGQAAVIVLVLDGKAGLTAGDHQLAARLRPAAARVVLAWNKADQPRQSLESAEAFELGLGGAVAVSAEHGLGIADLVQAIAERLPGDSGQWLVPTEEEISVAIVGRPNVGKSSLLNRLCGSERATVAPEPGTTRDAIDTEVVRRGRRFRFVDTAGIRRASRATDRLEKLGIMMARRSIERSDVALVLVDAAEGFVAQDLTVAGLVEEMGKGAVLVVNKWDLVQDKEDRFEALKQQARARLRLAHWAPLVSISATQGLRVEALYSLVERVDAASATMIPTPRLNRFLGEFRGGGDGGSPGMRLRYLTQTSIRPPSFLAFGPGAGRLHFSEVRRLENRLREAFEIGPTPIRIRFRRESLGRSRRRGRPSCT